MQSTTIRQVLIAAVAVFSTLFSPAFAQTREHSSEQSAPPATSQSTPHLPAVRLDGNYFSRDGHRFIPVGANWVPAVKAMQWPTEWDRKAIEADFARMHELGFNTIRLDFVWAWIEPRPGDYNPDAFRAIDFLISLAHRYQIYLHPELLIGGEVGEAFWDVPYRQGRHPHSDPDMLRIETDHVAELARRYANEPAILGWDLTDEPPFWIAPETTDAMAINWTRLLSWSMRRYDKLHPIVVGTSMEDVGRGPFRPDNIRDEADFFSVHPYSIYAPKLFPDAMLSERGTYGSAFETALSGSAGKPVMVQEIGASSAQYDPEEIEKFLRASLYSGLGAGANGFLIWCYTDAAPEQFHKVPYLRSPHETQFGLTTWEGKDRPSAKMFKEFEDVVGRLDLTGIEPTPADAGIIVPYEWSKPHGDFSHFGLTGPEVVPYTSTDEGANVVGQSQPTFNEENEWITGSWLSSFVLARRAGMKADFPREYDDWQKRPMVLMPSPLTSTDRFLVHVHSDFWEKARQYVSKGGALYASVAADAAIPEMEAVFGARMVDGNPKDDVTIKVVVPFGNLKPGDTFHYSVPNPGPRSWGSILEVKGGTVIAVDQDGRPALVANKIGSGHTLLSAYPIETYLANSPAVFDRPEASSRIYQAFRVWSGVTPRFYTDQPSVEALSLGGSSHSYVVVTNHSAATQTVTVTASQPLHTVSGVSAQGTRQVEASKTSFKVVLSAYDGAVFEVK
ncbi:MAG TPA: beta-galactosidase [Candidatus Deferrimicrobiaceae bacterium]|nr:beta-galactosidase [Candidatus Deferrimicrobiaceae bacterium]